MKQTYVKRLMSCVLLCGSAASFAQFSGDFAPANWTTSAPVGGTVNSSGAPANIVMTGPNMSAAGNLDYSTTIDACQGVMLSFNWAVVHPDDGYDNMYYGVNGVYTYITDTDGS